MAGVRYHEGQFPPRTLDWQVLVPLIGPASAALARYDGMLAAIPNPGVLLAPLGTQEAVLSSRIEGTQATMGEVLEYEAGNDTAAGARRDDIHEILNYRKAMWTAAELLRDLPFSQRVIRDVHRILLAGVRGANKSLGEYRRVPNWIGPERGGIEEARFVPIGADKLTDAMSAWEAYAYEDPPDSLVQLALLHVEFEALHPFLDGNGRLGRMLVPLFLWQRDLIGLPMFYISAYFEAHREAYYERLLAVSRDEDWTGWCRFFLIAVREQAEDNLARAKAILALYDELRHRMPEMTRSQYATKALDWLFAQPIFSSSDFIAVSAIPESTARRFLRLLRDEEILSQIQPASGSRPAILAFARLLEIAEGRKAD